MKSCKELLGLVPQTGEVAKNGCSSTFHCANVCILCLTLEPTISNQQLRGWSLRVPLRAPLLRRALDASVPRL